MISERTSSDAQAGSERVSGHFRRTISDLPEQERVAAVGAGLTDQTLSVWPERFSVRCVAALVGAGIAVEQAERWPSRFDGAGIVALEAAAKADPVEPITPDIAGQFPDRFNGKAVAELFLAGFDPDVVASYPARFSSIEIEWARDAQLSGPDSHAYPTWLPGPLIAAAARRHITPQELVGLADGVWGPPDPSATACMRLHWELLGRLLSVCDLEDIRPLQQPPLPTGMVLRSVDDGHDT